MERSELRNRIVEVIQVVGRELLDNEGNPRYHPAMQRAAARGLLAEVGIVDVLLAYRRNAGGVK
jgi:hypothetical protein